MSGQLKTLGFFLRMCYLVKRTGCLNQADIHCHSLTLPGIEATAPS